MNPSNIPINAESSQLTSGLLMIQGRILGIILVDDSGEDICMCIKIKNKVVRMWILIDIC